MGKRHLRTLYDILIDPTITTRTKNNGFLKYVAGRKYLQSLEEISNLRVFCKGIHKMDRIEGTIKGRTISKYQINKFNQDFKSLINVYRKERELNRQKYQQFLSNLDDGYDDKRLKMSDTDSYNDDEDDDMEQDEDVDLDEEGDEISLSLNIKNKRRSFKHSISIDSNGGGATGISIHVSSKRRKKRKLSHLDRLQERNPSKQSKQTASLLRRRSPRLLNLKRSASLLSDDDI